LKKVLVADDEKSLRLLISDTLEIGNFIVIQADNGLDAWKLVTEQKPDLVILDVMMPEMTGYQVCKLIKSNEELQKIKVVILTAKGQEADRVAALDVLADFYIAKPFSPAKLLSLVEDVLGES
jgi:DNA-binding response OmpR family regulator